MGRPLSRFCVVCHQEFRQYVDHPPVQCPRCHSRKWNREVQDDNSQTINAVDSQMGIKGREGEESIRVS